MAVFEKDDLVAVFGGEVGEDEEFADKINICRVLVVGDQDLIVEESSTSSFSRPGYHIVPKGICHKLKLENKKLSELKQLKPEVGDLVLSFMRDSYKDDPAVEFTGIVYKIFYKFGKPSKCTLICGKEFKEAWYESLIVLQRNK